MTQHNITGSEAFKPNAHVLVRMAARARRPWNPVAKVFAASAGLGLVASLLDSLIGAPVFLVLCATGFVTLWAWPSR